VTREDRPTSPRQFSVWCSQRDIAQMVECCIEAPATLRFGLLFAVSNNRWNYRDLTHARAVVGYEPLDRAEDHR
jgi:uronate dehydrogenase